MRYIDIDAIADKNLNWNVLVGARRIGKTYGVLKREILLGKKFIYMRRTERELATAISKDIFKTLNRDLGTAYTAEYKKTDGFGYIYSDTEKTNMVGYALPMSTAQHFRGIDYSDIDELVFDEFIPEIHQRQSEYEGLTFINMIETIFSNRELEGFEPMKVWLLSNPINLFDPILNALNVTDILANMQLNDQSNYTDRDRSLYVFRGTKTEIMEAKKNTSLYKILGSTDNSILSNVLGGDFIGDELYQLKRIVNFKEYIPAFDIDGEIYIYIHKTDSTWYVTDIKQPTRKHYSRKAILPIRKEYATKYQLLKSINRVQFKSVELYQIIDAILG